LEPNSKVSGGLKNEGHGIGKDFTTEREASKISRFTSAYTWF